MNFSSYNSTFSYIIKHFRSGDIGVPKQQESFPKKKSLFPKKRESSLFGKINMATVR